MILLLTSLALAADPAAAPALTDDPDLVVVRSPVTEVDFDGVDVNASVDRPSLSLVTEPARPRFPSLIRLRYAWADEMEVEEGWAR